MVLGKEGLSASSLFSCFPLFLKIYDLLYYVLVLLMSWWGIFLYYVLVLLMSLWRIPLVFYVKIGYQFSFGCFCVFLLFSTSCAICYALQRLVFVWAHASCVFVKSCSGFFIAKLNFIIYDLTLCWKARWEIKE
jgi:hypothetical protein